MRSVLNRQVAPRDLRRQVERLEGLPLRPATARLILAECGDDSDELEAASGPLDASRLSSIGEFDPGWVLARSRFSAPSSALEVVATHSWWSATSRDGADALIRLLRHGAAVSLAARRLARESGESDAEGVARAGLLHNLGLWAIAAVDPEWLARWLALSEPGARRELEIQDLGTAAGTLGRSLAERWGCDPLVCDAAWLHEVADQGLGEAAADRKRIGWIQQAHGLAERTPWSLSGYDLREGGSHEPRVKLLIAEVQSRCGPQFHDIDVSVREESLTRSNARLRIRVASLASGLEGRDRFLRSMAESDARDAPNMWAERASLAWCGEAGVSAARVVWRGEEEKLAEMDERPPGLRFPLTTKGREHASVLLWSEDAEATGDSISDLSKSAWSAWAGWVADRERQSGRLDKVLQAYRSLSASWEARLGEAKLEAVAEFAAGAGHELNNPLAVIVGRAQLLMVRETDPKVLRSLRAILTQAQRAHRMLRDLMYVARPPEPRPRFCSPDEIIRASVRDAGVDAEEREVRILAEPIEHGLRAWADPDGLRHVTDSLIRNALEATPRGGRVVVSTSGDATCLRLSVQDSGRGITPSEGNHLFDPFYCGRQAGRGLGMGLPRVSRFIRQVGGEIRWHSTPGQGSTFHVRLPLEEPPGPALDESGLGGGGSGPRNGQDQVGLV